MESMLNKSLRRVHFCVPSFFEEMTWWSISAYFKKFATEEAKKKYRNRSQQRKYIVETLEMPLQFDRGGLTHVDENKMRTIDF